MQGVIDKVYAELKGAWRFRRYGLIAAWAVCLVGWLVVYVLPDPFDVARAGQRRHAHGAAVRCSKASPCDQDVESQLNLMRQALLGRANLDKVATASRARSSRR